MYLAKVYDYSFYIVPDAKLVFFWTHNSPEPLYSIARVEGLIALKLSEAESFRAIISYGNIGVF